jgi:hypothetical protein
LPVGAPGSKHVTAKLFVPAGTSSRRRCGERLPAPQPKRLFSLLFALVKGDGGGALAGA